MQESRACGRFRLEGIKPLVGDYVTLEKEAEGATALVTQILPRRNELTRPRAANVDMLAVVLSPRKPRSNLLLCDKLLAEARRQAIAPAVIINKTDAWPELAAELGREYRDAADVYLVSAQTGDGVRDLAEAMRGRTVCLTGQSAVGKSSLLKCLAGSNVRETGGLSRKTDRGRHTTRSVEIIDIPAYDLALIDTPGFSVLASPDKVDRPLAEFYPEFAPYAGRCRFDSCRHDREPDCAVKAAVEAGAIERGRYERYLKLLDEGQGSL